MRLHEAKSSAHLVCLLPKLTNNVMPEAFQEARRWKMYAPNTTARAKNLIGVVARHKTPMTKNRTRLQKESDRRRKPSIPQPMATAATEAAQKGKDIPPAALLQKKSPIVTEGVGYDEGQKP